MGKKSTARSIKVEEKYVKFYKMFHKKCKNDQNLILRQWSKFEQRIKCERDY